MNLPEGRKATVTTDGHIFLCCCDFNPELKISFFFFEPFATCHCVGGSTKKFHVIVLIATPLFRKKGGQKLKAW